MRKYPQQSEQVKEFAASVCGHVKAKWVHNLLSYELTGHIEDQKSAYIAAGIDEFTAEARAIADMGDPAELGGYYNQVHRYRRDLIPGVIMWVIAGIIALVGTVGGGIWIAMAVIAGAGRLSYALGVSFMLFGWLIAFAFVTVCKVTGDWVFGHLLVRDYQRRRENLLKRGGNNS